MLILLGSSQLLGHLGLLQLPGLLGLLQLLGLLGLLQLLGLLVLLQLLVLLGFAEHNAKHTCKTHLQINTSKTLIQKQQLLSKFLKHFAEPLPGQRTKKTNPS